MTTSQELLNDFMNKQNKKFVGEKVAVNTNDENGDFTPDVEKAKKFDTAFNAVSGDKSYIAARRTLATILQIPIVVGGMLSLIYILMKLTPIVIGYIRKLLIILSTGSI